MFGKPAVWLVMCSMLLLARLAISQEFRIETEILGEDQKAPLVENLTIFSNGRVYDFRLTEPRETTVFDPNRARIDILDPARKQRTTVTLEQLKTLAATLQAQAAERKVSIPTESDFRAEFDDATDWLTLRSDRQTYRVKGTAPKYNEAMRRYREFADAYARLNGARPGNLPPFGRLRLNEELEKRTLIPSEVELTIHAKKPLVLRSKHVVTWLLSKKDHDLVEEAGTGIVSFPSQGYTEYLQAYSARAQEKLR